MFSIHFHVTSWLVGLLLFIITWALLSKGKIQVANIIHNVNRVVFLAILSTGFILLYRYTQAPVWSDFGVEVVVKALAGIWLIVVIEWFIARFKQGAGYRGLVVQIIFMLLIVFILGFGRLPWGFSP